MAGPQRPARGCGVLPRPRSGLSPASRIPPLRRGRRPLRRPGRPGGPCSTGPHGRRSRIIIGLRNYWPLQDLSWNAQVDCLARRPAADRTRLAGDGRIPYAAPQR